MRKKGGFWELAVFAVLFIVIVLIAVRSLGHKVSAQFMTVCISAGAQVSTPNGNIAIELLEVGSPVFSVNSDWSIETSQVIRTKKALARESLEIFSLNHSLELTRVHPVYTKEGWIIAGDLQIGQEIFTENGYETINQILVHNNTLEVVDLSVESNENFFANGVLVHNKQL